MISCLNVLAHKFIIEIVVRFGVILALDGLNFLFFNLLKQTFELFIISGDNYCIRKLDAELDEALEIGGLQVAQHVVFDVHHLYFIQ